ncbi:M23 family metallopeptidase [Cellulomonas sp. H30R-01]|uniref:M23 family metallopeptidase n=1 Tax=Cellulomonas sp. H30R-01 TaxID=2704467 RepID=UPI00138BA221|nr:M23 family metallopeptidase [Cellulomonas sp. H30R-01]QHT54720.1 M23 family metallopeptidase [Cellulomonas sp. H30R-01]
MEAITATLVLWAKTEALGWLARHWRKLVVAVVVVGSAAVFVGVAAVTLVSSSGQAGAAANACTELGYTVDQAAYRPPPLDDSPAIPSGGAVPGFGPDDGDKIANAQAIIAAGAAAGVGRRGLIVAIATALQESGLRNLDHGDRDSLGLFQQRPSQGWGTPQQVRDPTFAALAFFGGRTSPHFSPATGRASPAGLVDVTGWAEVPLTVAAQSVQRSAFPSAYAKHEARATVIVDALASESPVAESGGAVMVGQPLSDQPSRVTAADYRANGVDIDAFCSSTFQLASSTGTPGQPSGQVVPAGEWTAPLEARITSAFGMRFHPVFQEWRLHAGTDFHAAVGTAITSPTVGVVHSVSWSSGGGLTITIAHASGVETEHLHLSEALVNPGDHVLGGQVIALSGDSGVGTGPHYHFEVHVNGVAVDPEGFMVQRGVNLRAWS